MQALTLAFPAETGEQAGICRLSNVLWEEWKTERVPRQRTLHFCCQPGMCKPGKDVRSIGWLSLLPRARTMVEKIRLTPD